MVGQNILFNNVHKITANRNSLVCLERFLQRQCSVLLCFVYVSERDFHPFILLLNVETYLPNQKPPICRSTHVSIVLALK